MANENISSSMAGLSKSQLYDVMCQMKNLIEQNQQQAREILVQNPMLTKTLFQAQIMLGMVQPPQVMPTIPQMASQHPQQSQQVVQQVNATATQSLPSQNEPQSQSNINHSQLSSRPQHPTMTAISNSSFSIPQAIPQPQIQSMNTIQAMQQPKVNVNQQVSVSLPQSTQHHSVPQNLPMHSGSQLSLLQSQSSTVSGQSQPSLQTTGFVPQPLQPPLPLQPRPPSMQPFSHPIHSQVPISAGFQQSGVPQQLGVQSVFHSGNNPSSGSQASSFPPAQPPLPSQLPPQQLYRVGGSLNDQGGGNSMPVERGPWISTQGSQHENVQVAVGVPQPFAFGQTNLANQTSRPPQLTPEMEKALLHQVMNLTPEQINLLPPEQRNQVLQLQQILR